MDRKQQHKFSSKKDEKKLQRREVNVQLRKNAREEQMQKRRNLEDCNTSPLKSPSKTDAESRSPLRENSNTNKAKIDLGDTNLKLPEILELFKSPIQRDQLRAVTATRRLLSKDDKPPVNKVIKAGLIPVLVSKLDDKLVQMKFEAAWALTNVASGTAEQTLCVAKNGAIPKMVNLLMEDDDEVVDQAVWGLGNMAGDGAHLRDMVLQCGTVPGIMRHIRSDKKIGYLRNLTWMISNLCRNKPEPKLEMVAPLLEPLNCLIQFNDRATQTDAAWAISYITDSSGDHAKAVCATNNMVPTLISHIATCGDDKLITPSLRAVGNIITGADELTQFCLENGFLQCVKVLFEMRKKNILKEACWALSNVTAGTKQQVQAVVDFGLMPTVVNLLHHTDYKIQKEAAWTVCNLVTAGNFSNIEHCVQNGAIEGLRRLLNCTDSDTLVCVLDGYTRILECGERNGTTSYCDKVEECGALDEIEALQEAQNDDVYEKANKIIENFFGEDEIESAQVNNEGYYNFSASDAQAQNQANAFSLIIYLQAICLLAKH